LPLGEPCVASLRRAMGTRRRRCDAAPLWAARDVNDAGAGYACGVTIAIRVMRPVDATRCPAICATIGGYDKRMLFETRAVPRFAAKTGRAPAAGSGLMAPPTREGDAAAGRDAHLYATDAALFSHR
jgi:hypothetical protein